MVNRLSSAGYSTYMEHGSEQSFDKIEHGGAIS